MSELIDNRAQRVRTLKHVIRHLHEGRAPGEVKRQMEQLVRECSAGEIASMEQELIAEGVPASEIRHMCDLHSQVVRDVLVEKRAAPPPPGHPVDTFRRENAALTEQAAALRGAFDRLLPADAAPEAEVDGEALLACRRLYGGLMDVEKHYQRKEHLLFSCLERHGITGPSTVMWGKDDEVRGLLRAVGEALQEQGGTLGEWGVVREAVVEPALRALEEMVFKEERILLPMSLENLTPGEWDEIRAQSPQFGYCLVDPREGGGPSAAEEPATASAPSFVAGSRAVPLAMAGRRPDAAAPREAPVEALPSRDPGRVIVFPTGALTTAQLAGLFSALPVDVTFVDAEDRVRFFSEGKDRVFARPRAVIGRQVQHCHPPSSVHLVERILGDFRAGRESVAEFWIDLRGRFIHIRYFAVRDTDGAYLGCLEVTQDLTRERALTGERRLLHDDATSEPASA